MFLSPFVSRLLRAAAVAAVVRQVSPALAGRVFSNEDEDGQRSRARPPDKPPSVDAPPEDYRTSTSRLPWTFPVDNPMIPHRWTEKPTHFWDDYNETFTATSKTPHVRPPNTEALAWMDDPFLDVAAGSVWDADVPVWWPKTATQEEYWRCADSYGEDCPDEVKVAYLLDDMGGAWLWQVLTPFTVENAEIWHPKTDAQRPRWKFGPATKDKGKKGKRSWWWPWGEEEDPKDEPLLFFPQTPYWWPLVYPPIEFWQCLWSDGRDCPPGISLIEGGGGDVGVWESTWEVHMEEIDHRPAHWDPTRLTPTEGEVDENGDEISDDSHKRQKRADRRIPSWWPGDESSFQRCLSSGGTKCPPGVNYLGSFERGAKTYHEFQTDHETYRKRKPNPHKLKENGSPVRARDTGVAAAARARALVWAAAHLPLRNISPGVNGPLSQTLSAISRRDSGRLSTHYLSEVPAWWRASDREYFLCLDTFGKDCPPGVRLVLSEWWGNRVLYAHWHHEWDPAPGVELVEYSRDANKTKEYLTPVPEWWKAKDKEYYECLNSRGKKCPLGVIIKDWWEADNNTMSIRWKHPWAVEGESLNLFEAEKEGEVETEGETEGETKRKQDKKGKSKNKNKSKNGDGNF